MSCKHAADETASPFDTAHFSLKQSETNTREHVGPDFKTRAVESEQQLNYWARAGSKLSPAGRDGCGSPRSAVGPDACPAGRPSCRGSEGRLSPLPLPRTDASLILMFVGSINKTYVRLSSLRPHAAARTDGLVQRQFRSDLT